MFEPIQPGINSTYEVIRQIIDNIKTGELKPGDALPTERSLSETFGISRPGVREALNALRVMNVIHSVHGGHNYISEDFKSSLVMPLGIIFRINNSNLIEAEQLRAALECRSAYLAAKNFKPSDKEALTKILNKWHKAKTLKQKQEYDQQFHLKIAEISGNSILYTALSASKEITDNIILSAYNIYSTKVDNDKAVAEQHDALLAALCNNDPEGAEKAMRAHLDHTEHYIAMVTETMTKDEIAALHA